MCMHDAMVVFLCCCSMRLCAYISSDSAPHECAYICFRFYVLVKLHWHLKPTCYPISCKCVFHRKTYLTAALSLLCLPAWSKNSLGPKFQIPKLKTIYFSFARAGLCSLAIWESRKILIYQVHLIKIGPNSHCTCYAGVLFSFNLQLWLETFCWVSWLETLKSSCKLGCCWAFDARLAGHPASTTRLFVVLGKWSCS